MLQIVKSYVLDGIIARPVAVEVDVHRGLPGFAIVGLPDHAVREVRERVRAAIVNAGLEFPLSRVVVNLAPARLTRSAARLDLPIAVGVLLASAQLDPDVAAHSAFVGELNLDGTLRSTRGTLQCAEAARAEGDSALILPEINAQEAALVEGIDLICLDTLGRLPALAAGDWEPPRPAAPSPPLRPGEPDLADLRGQPHLRRALELAAAGGHNLLIVGPPGAGKALAATRLPSILPPLTSPELLEVMRIASATGRLKPPSTVGRPFRAPHHSIGPAALLGGGRPPGPGEVTLAHRGVLFLDHLPEFRRDVIEALRGPIDHGTVDVFQGDRRTNLPSAFLLVAAASPCPCGHGDADPACCCSAAEVNRYQNRIRAALPGRLEIRIGLRAPSASEMAGPRGEASAVVRSRVIEARRRQEFRLGAGRCNAQMTRAEVEACPLDPEATELLGARLAGPPLNATDHYRVVRVAQTIADLAGASAIAPQHVSEAFGLRRRDS